MIEKNYSIHDVVKFKIIGRSLSDRLTIEYKNFEVQSIEEPDFVVYIGKFKPQIEGCFVLDNKYYIKDGYFYCKDSYKHGKWEIEVIGLEEEQTIVNLNLNYIGKRFADMFISAFVIDFLIRFKLEQKGYSVVHASAVAKNGIGFLFPSQSGAGKTTTAVYFVGEGYGYLGDDFVIIHKGEVLSYLTPLNIFSYNLNPRISQRLSPFDRVVLRAKSLLYRFGHIKIFTKVDPAEIFSSNITEKAKLKAIFLLEQGASVRVEPVDREHVINGMHINQKLESFPFFKYLLEYSYVYPDSYIAKHWKKCRDNLSKNITQNIKFYKLIVPKKYDIQTFLKVKEVVEDVSKNL